MTVKEFAKKANVPWRTIYNLINRGFFPFINVYGNLTDRDIKYFKKHYLMEGYFSTKEMCEKIDIKPSYMDYLMKHGFWDGLLPVKNEWNKRLYWNEEHIEYYKEHKDILGKGNISEIEYNGETMSKKEFSERIDIPYEVVRGRFKNNWTVEEIAKYPVLKNTKVRRLLYYEDRYYTCKEFSKLVGICEKSIKNYIKRGFTCQEIVNLINNKPPNKKYLNNKR